MNRKILAMVGVSAMMVGLVACGSKAESNIAESATPAPTAEATPTPEPTEEPAESHDFDLSVNKYKTERNIEIKQYSGDSVSDTADCDSGTDIEELDTLYDWLYSNGVTKESVQNDRDSGCKNPYLEGYLEYLDNLDKPSEESENPDDVQYADDGSAVIDYTDEELAAIEAAGGLSADEWNEQVEDISDEVHERNESGETLKMLEEMAKNHPDWNLKG